MAIDLLKATNAYMTLWKSLDAFFPGRLLLEITNEPIEEIIEELQALSNEDIAAWAPDPQLLRNEIDRTLLRVREKNKDRSWYNEARILKETFGDKALSLASQLPDPPPLYFTAHPKS